MTDTADTADTRPADATADELRIHRIPLAEIGSEALPRDRSRPCPAAQAELRDSIAVNGLRMPIEVWEFETPRGDHRYGLISGWRRLSAFRSISEYIGPGSPFDTIPAFVRKPESMQAALTAVAEENAVRDSISPWERGAFIVRTVDERAFLTIEEATDALYPTAAPSVRSRHRSVARVVAAFGDRLLTNPETLTLRQLLRIDAACRKGFEDDIGLALGEVRGHATGLQFQAIEPILREAEREAIDVEIPDTRIDTPGERPRGRPRRIVDVRPGLTIRRESLGNSGGYRLHFTGPEATAYMVQHIMDEVVRMYGRDF